MLIACPHCATSYDIEAEKLAGGRTVRCARCRATWHASAPAPTAALGADTLAATREADVLASRDQPGGRASWNAAYGEAATDEAPAAADAPPLVPALATSEFAEHAHQAEAEPEDIESFALRRARLVRERAARRRRSLPLLPTAILLLTAAIGGLISWRTHIVAMAPQTASLYAAVGLPVNLRGLVFEAVKTVDEMHEGVPVLVVDGTIVNAVNATVPVPRLRFAVRDAAGIEVYAWTARPARSILGAGETLPFRSRLASPPTNGHDLVVRFFHRRDLDAAD